MELFSIRIQRTFQLVSTIMCIYSYLLQKYNICSDNQLLMKSFFTCCIVETAFPVSFATFRIE